jgi:uncharacterized membrane protein YdjX (TVP38/TMEM64 family)
MPLLSWVYKWAGIVGGAIAAVLAALFIGRRQGAKATKAEVTAATEHSAVVAAEQRQEVETRVDTLAPAAPTPIGTADAAAPGSAADELRKHWTRD